jgi:hypothetical protein
MLFVIPSPRRRSQHRAAGDHREDPDPPTSARAMPWACRRGPPPLTKRHRNDHIRSILKTTGRAPSRQPEDVAPSVFTRGDGGAHAHSSATTSRVRAQQGSRHASWRQAVSAPLLLLPDARRAVRPRPMLRWKALGASSPVGCGRAGGYSMARERAKRFYTCVPSHMQPNRPHVPLDSPIRWGGYSRPIRDGGIARRSRGLRRPTPPGPAAGGAGAVSPEMWPLGLPLTRPRSLIPSMCGCA